MLAATAVQAQTSPDELYQQGVEAYRSGRANEAITLLERVVAAQPDNADAWVQLGYARLASGDLAGAEDAFRRTLAIAPDYADAHVGMARIAQRRGDLSGALSTLEPVDPTNADASALRAQILSGPPGEVASPYRWSLDLNGSYSFVEERADWKEFSARISYRPTDGTTLSSVVETSRRFGLNDTYGELRIDRRFSPGANGYVFVGGTPDADFRPKWQIGFGGGVRVDSDPGGTVLTLDVLQSHYAVGDIQTLSPGIEQYFGGNAWLTGRWINIFDEDGGHHSGWLVRGDVLATPKVRLFGGLADAPDTSEGMVVETFSVFGGLSWDIDERSTLRFTVAHEERDTGSDRAQASLGMGWRF